MISRSIASSADDQGECMISQRPATVWIDDSHAIVGVRPEHLTIDGDSYVPARVTLVEALGHERHVTCGLDDGTTIVARVPAHVSVPDEGSPVKVGALAGHLHHFDPATGVRLP